MIDEPKPLKGLFDWDPWTTWARQMTDAMNAVVRQQSQVLAMLGNITTLLQQERKAVMATQQTLTDLQAAITENASAIDSATQLMQGLAEQIKTAVASGDDAAVETLAQQLHTQAGQLAAAVVANTPTSPAVPAAAPPDAPPANPAPPADETTQPQPAPMQAKAPQHSGRHK